ncbi:MAG: ABC transporter ATP-binding protein [Pseudorhodoplanes sp.]
MAADPAAEAMITANAVSKWFRVNNDGKSSAAPELRYALKDVSLQVARGECIALLGPSGCGKTTLLRMIAGLLKPSGGSIFVDGAPVLKPQRDRCMVFQHFGLLPWRNVLENIAFPLELDGFSKPQRLEKAQELMSLVGLSDYARHYPHEISGGMQQRAGLARALVRKPILLMMDEPFGALDSQTREQLQEEFLGIRQLTGQTVILVTHAIDEAILLSNRVIVMDSGPGRIKEIVDIPFAMENRDALEMRAAPVFVELSRHLRDQLRH